jgi:hypothetical protein
MVILRDVGIGMPLTIEPVAETSFIRNEEDVRLVLQLYRVNVSVSDRSVVDSASWRRRVGHSQI